MVVENTYTVVGVTLSIQDMIYTIRSYRQIVIYDLKCTRQMNIDIEAVIKGLQVQI